MTEVAKAKELNEFLWALGFIGGNLDEALADGPGIEDMKSVMEVLKENQKLVEGIKGFDKIKDEVKDMEAGDFKNAVLGLFDAYREGQE